MEIVEKLFSSESPWFAQNAQNSAGEGEIIKTDWGRVVGTLKLNHGAHIT